MPLGVKTLADTKPTNGVPDTFGFVWQFETIFAVVNRWLMFKRGWRWLDAGFQLPDCRPVHYLRHRFGWHAAARAAIADGIAPFSTCQRGANGLPNYSHMLNEACADACGVAGDRTPIE